jgi:type II secretory pathway component PulF
MLTKIISSLSYLLSGWWWWCFLFFFFFFFFSFRVASNKVKALTDAGAIVADSPAKIGALMLEAMKKAGLA